MNAIKQIKNILIPLFLIVLCACSSRYGDNDLSKRNVLITSDPSLKITRTTPLTWYSNITLHGTPASSNASEMITYIQQLISNTLIDKGFNLNKVQSKSQYQVVAVAMVGNNDANEKILELFKLFPGLSTDSNYQQGTLLVAIVDVNQRKAAWRGSVQMFVDPDLPKELRLERINSAVARLLRQLKPAV